MTASANDMNPEYKNSAKRRVGFLDQKLLDNLAVTLEGETVKIFSNPYFLAALQQQATASMQGEPLTFLQEIYQVNQRNLSTADLQIETARLANKYINDSSSPNCLNVGIGPNLNQYNELLQEGKMLASFRPIVLEMCLLVQTNMCRPITLFAENRTMSKEEVTKQLVEAYQQDKFFPARSVICSALEGINMAFNKPITQSTVLSDKEKQLSTLVVRHRADTLVEESIKRVSKIHNELTEVLKQTVVADASVAQIQEDITRILVESVTVLQRSSDEINKALGKPNSRSRRIDDFLGSLAAAKEWHAILMLDTQTLSFNERAEKEFLKNSSLFACHTESNTRTVEKYMNQIKTAEESVSEEASVTATLAERRQP